jgi:hypothetical protein
MTKSRNLRAPHRPWTPAELAVVRRDYANTRTQEIATALARSYAAVVRMANALGLYKSAQFLQSPVSGRLDGTQGACARFAKGMQPWNKGLHYDPGGDKRTRYQPGNISGRAAQLLLPVGSERVNTDGVLVRKVSDTLLPVHHRWRAVHRLVWEAAHGAVPAGHVVAFRPGRRTTDVALIALDALELLTRVQMMQRNTLHRYGPEVARAVQMGGALTRQINKFNKFTTDKAKGAPL